VRCDNCANGIVIYGGQEMECLRCFGSGDTDPNVKLSFAKLPESERKRLRSISATAHRIVEGEK
jgi:hypothetical protein